MAFFMIDGRLFEERDGSYHPVSGIEPVPVAGYAPMEQHMPEFGDHPGAELRAQPLAGGRGHPGIAVASPPRLPGYRRNPMMPVGLQALASAPRLADRRVVGFPSNRASADIVISKSNVPRLSGSLAGRIDPIKPFDATANYQRGDGFSEGEWRDFDRAQQSAARASDRAVRDLTRRADDLDRKGRDGGAILREEADAIRRNAENLRNTSPDAPKAHLPLTDAEYFARRAQENYADEPDSQEFTTRDNRHTYFRRGDVGIQGGQDRAEQIIAHAGFHTIGLEDERGPNGELAYRAGRDAQIKAFRSIRGTRKAARNPDSLVSRIYPRNALDPNQ